MRKRILSLPRAAGSCNYNDLNGCLFHSPNHVQNLQMSLSGCQRHRERLPSRAAYTALDTLGQKQSLSNSTNEYFEMFSYSR